MKILVTGSKGFIGTKLVPYLLSHKHEVIGIDQYILSEENYCRADISILGELLHIFQSNTFDLVIHLASECGIENCEEHIQKFACVRATAATPTPDPAPGSPIPPSPSLSPSAGAASLS